MPPEPLPRLRRGKSFTQSEMQMQMQMLLQILPQISSIQ